MTVINGNLAINGNLNGRELRNSNASIRPPLPDCPVALLIVCQAEKIAELRRSSSVTINIIRPITMAKFPNLPNISKKACLSVHANPGSNIFLSKI